MEVPTPTIDKLIDGDEYVLPATLTLRNPKTGETTTKEVVDRVPRKPILEEMDLKDEEQDVFDFLKPTYKRIHLYAEMLDHEKEFMKHKNPRILEQRTAELIKAFLHTYKRLVLSDVEKVFRHAELQTTLVAIHKDDPRLEGKSVRNNKGNVCEYTFATVFASTDLRDEFYKGQRIEPGDVEENMRRLECAGSFLE